MTARVIECLTLTPLQGCNGACLIRMCHGPCVDSVESSSAGAAGALAPNSEWLGHGKPGPFVTRADCRKSLLTPVCGAVSQLCEICADPEQDRSSSDRRFILPSAWNGWQLWATHTVRRLCHLTCEEP